MLGRRLLLAAFVVCCSLTVPLATNAARQAPAATSVEAQADTVVSAAMKEQSIPGVSIAIAHGGRTLVAKGYDLANVELDVKASPSTVYRIGSLTKQFTAASVMRLVEAGKMSLDDPIEKYLPEYPIGSRRITIRHLLTHTSGIKSYPGPSSTRPT